MAKTKRQILPIYGRKLKRSQMVEIIIPQNTGTAPKTKLNFPDIQNLRDVRLEHIKFYTSSDFVISPLSGTNLIDDITARSIFISLQGYNGKIFCSQKPAITLKTSYQGRVTNNNPFLYESFPVNFTGQKVNWPKSFIEIADAATISAVQNQVFLCKIYYTGTPAQEEKAAKAKFSKRS